MQFALIAFSVIVPSLIEALLLRAAVATSNRLWKSSYPLKEPTFLAALNTMFVANVIAALVAWFLPTEWSLLKKVLLSGTAKWLFVGLSFADQYRTSIDRVLVIIALVILYFVLLSLLFAIPYVFIVL